MSRRKKDPLRPSTDAELHTVIQLSRSQVAPAVQVARAQILLAVDGGDDDQAAARSDAAPAMPSRTLSPASTLRASPH